MKKIKKQDGKFLNISKELRKLSLFDKLPEKILIHFAEKSRVRTQPKGKLLFLHGDDADAFYIIINGWVKLFTQTVEGSEAIMDILTKGNVFAETSIFNKGQHITNAEAIEDTQYIALPTSLLKYYAQRDWQMALNLLDALSAYQTRQNSEIEHLNIQNAQQRIGCFLLRLCNSDRQNPIDLNLPYNKTLIAARLGMKPETFSRALAKLKEDTNIQIKGSTITVTDIQKIIDYTCSHCSQSFPCNDSRHEPSV